MIVNMSLIFWYKAHIKLFFDNKAAIYLLQSMQKNMTLYISLLSLIMIWQL